MDEPKVHEKHETKDEPGRTLVARFGSRAEGRDAIAALHKAHYGHTWLGSTSLAQTPRGDETVTVESGGFFSGAQSLVDALVSRGVSGASARALERQIDAGNALVTVDPKDKDPQEAIAILQSHGGNVAGHATSPDPSARRSAVPIHSSADVADPSDIEWEEMVFERRL